MNDEWSQIAANAMIRDHDVMCNVIAENSTLPHVLMRPALSVDGGQWCALYGSNLQDGVAGFGDTPDKAMHDFNRNWWNQKAKS